MFNKQILKQDVNHLTSLQAKKKTCKHLLSAYLHDLIFTDVNSQETLSIINDLNNQVHEYECEISILNEQTFFNYVNNYKHSPSNPIPHIDTLK